MQSETLWFKDDGSLTLTLCETNLKTKSNDQQLSIYDKDSKII